MKKIFAPIALVAALGTAGCQNLSPQDQANLGLLAGAGAGLITANALNANANWTIVAALAGAAVGTLVARNAQTGNCAYSNGDGTYTVRPC
ncbi:hypothetical protein KUV65_07250 [Maritalea mobilis]|uniref:17 kDa surface antigen n=1 Tax=[Roseibacterium] beibuensis TaxID=1193142 RepID=A0ABP9KXD8_9RHOB|nr:MULTISPECIES: hypothetical protein [Alphaproteobacteria]MBY6201149.1 hypothetical protein [Maritalea mobilis]MCS6622175.1 glucose-6-phosphate isomerase [Roseibacterium beibuensis]